jgi:putative tricarboxylic transport membrane protein
MKKLFAVLMLIALFATAGAASAEWKPSRTIELIAPANPGGGWDMLCRTVQKALVDEKLVEKNVIVVNKPGGGGATGWNYLKGKKGQGEYLAATSTLIMLNNLLGKSEITYRDVTPIAALQTEWISIAVEQDSPWKTVKDLFEAIKANPSAVPIGVGPTLGNNDHLMFLELAQEFGVDPASIKFIVYPGAGGEIVPALLGGHVKATSIGLAEVLEQHKAGKMKVIGVSSDQKLDFLPDVAPFKEQGVDLVFPHWRGFVGAPDLTPEQVKYWDDVFSKMVQTETWKTLIDNLGWSNFYQNSAEHTAFLEESTKEFDSLLTQVGLK